LRCNQILLQETPTIARATTILLEQILYVIPLDASKTEFAPLHEVLLQLSLWIPRQELRQFQTSIVQKLIALALQYHLTSDCIAKSSLVESMLRVDDETLEAATAPMEFSDCLSSAKCFLFDVPKLKFESTDPINSRLELLLHSRILNNEEMTRASFNVAGRNSKNFSYSQLCSHDDIPGDDIVSLGMSIIHSPNQSIACVDAAVAFMGVAVSQLFDEAQAEDLLSTYVHELKVNVKLQSIKLLNCLIVLGIVLDIYSRKDVQLSPRLHPWVGKAKGILCVALSSPKGAVRRAAVQGLGILCKLGDESLVNSVVNTLKSKVIPSTPDMKISPYAKCGVAMALAVLRRGAGVYELKNLKNAVVYEMCKLTIQPVRIWALHAWNIIVESQGATVDKFIKPSIALINAHLLAMEGHPSRGLPGAQLSYNGTLTCLARILNTLITGLGPDLDRDEEDKLLNIWHSIRSFSNDQSLQLECIVILQQFLSFRPAFIVQVPQHCAQAAEFLSNHAFGFIGRYRSNVCRIQALRCLKLLSERDPLNSQQLFFNGKLPLAICELGTRDAICEDWNLPMANSNGWSTHLYLNDDKRLHQDPLVLNGYGYDTKPTDEYGMRSPLRDLGQLRQACLAATTELIDAEELNHSESIDTILRMTKITEWVMLFRAVLTGTAIQEETIKVSTTDDDEEPIVEATNENSLDHVVVELLQQCAWESRTLAGEGMLKLLAKFQGVPIQTDITLAKKILKDLSITPNKQFICLQLRELISGACQAANGTVQNAEIPQVSLLGYCALMTIVRMFAGIPDPFNPQVPLLKSYEFELVATLGPGLQANSSPITLPFVSSLALELISSGIVSSVNRVLVLLMPPEMNKGHDDDDDDEDLAEEEPEDSFPPCIRLEILLIRLSYLARLLLFACDIDQNGSYRSPPPTTLIVAPKKKNKKQHVSRQISVLEAFLPHLDDTENSVRHTWKCVVEDFALLSCPRTFGMVLKNDALSLMEAEDISGMPQVFVDCTWVIMRAFAALHRICPLKSTELHLVITCALQLISILGDACPVSMYLNCFGTLNDCLVAVTLEDLPEGLLLPLLDFSFSFTPKIRTCRPSEVQETTDLACGAMSAIVAPLLSSTAFTEFCIEFDSDHLIFQRVLEGCLAPLLDIPGGLDVADGEEYTYSKLQVESLRLLSSVVCPVDCRERYMSVYYLHALRALLHADAEPVLIIAGDIILNLLALKVGKSVVQLVTSLFRTRSCAKPLEYLRSEYFLRILAHSDSFSQDLSTSLVSSAEKKLSALKVLLVYLQGSHSPNKKQVLGMVIPQVCVLLDCSESSMYSSPLISSSQSIAEFACLIVTVACTVENDLISPTLHAIVSASEGVPFQLPQFIHTARTCLLSLTTKYPEQVRLAVGSLPPAVSVAMQNAIREQIQQAQ